MSIKVVYLIKPPIKDDLLIRSENLLYESSRAYRYAILTSKGRVIRHGNYGRTVMAVWGEIPALLKLPIHGLPGDLQLSHEEITPTSDYPI